MLPGLLIFASFNTEVMRYIFLLVLVAMCGKQTQAQKLHSLNVKSNTDVHQLFSYKSGIKPLISGHRGGIIPGYPENSIEAFENTLRHTPAFFEIDPRVTKDSVLILIHDATLNRTTNGTGKVADYSWAELKKLNLKDVNGNVTNYRIPTLQEAIIWAKGKTVLNLDKKNVPFEMTIKLINKMKADDRVMLTVHSAKEASFYHKANPKVMFSAHILKKETITEYEAAGIPWANIMAYVGPRVTPQTQELIAMLHKRGVRCMISAASTYDKDQDPNARSVAYQEILKSGADVIESDLPIEVAKSIGKR